MQSKDPLCLIAKSSLFWHPKHDSFRTGVNSFPLLTVRVFEQFVSFYAGLIISISLKAHALHVYCVR